MSEAWLPLDLILTMRPEVENGTGEKSSQSSHTGTGEKSSQSSHTGTGEKSSLSSHTDRLGREIVLGCWR